MADSTLSLTYTELLDAVAYFVYGKAYDDATAGEKSKCDEIVNIGYRQFLYPPTVEGIPQGYEWSFLRPVTTLETTEDDADQDLPDDFGRLIDGFTFEDNAQVPSVLADVGEGKIRRLRQQYSETGRPRVAGIRIKAGTGTVGQRREVMWFPTPDDAYTLGYKYEALTDKLTSDKPYPLGAMKHAETLRLSVLAAAAATMNDNYGIHWENFLRMLASSVKRDQREGQKYFGNVGSHGEYDEHPEGRLYNYSLTVSGVEIE